jgi:hypothetical protein
MSFSEIESVFLASKIMEKLTLNVYGRLGPFTIGVHLLSIFFYRFSTFFDLIYFNALGVVPFWIYPHLNISLKFSSNSDQFWCKSKLSSSSYALLHCLLSSHRILHDPLISFKPMGTKGLFIS